MTRVLFYREYDGFSGGQLIHSQYFEAIMSIPGVEAGLYYVSQNFDFAASPWREYSQQLMRRWEPEWADIIFVAGLDWRIFPRQEALELKKPFVNLIQHIRHAQPDDPRFTFLDRRALRICVSPEVEQALRRTGRCNGEIITIKNGIALPLRDQNARHRPNDVALTAIKQPALAVALQHRLARKGLRVDLIEQTIRSEFLDRLSAARIAVVLPGQEEGFYLPALEAMALGCIVVCPDCVGNRSFCYDSVNCLQPDTYDVDSLVRSVQRALMLSESQQAQMLRRAAETAAQYSKTAMESSIRTLFARIIENV